jgi:hypothetical protein
MSLVGVIAVVCDSCGKRADGTAEDVASARVASTRAGWELTRDAVAHRAVDRCPSCAVRPALADPSVPSSWVCPECEQGKHGNCNAWAWNFDEDEKTECQCPVVHA